MASKLGVYRIALLHLEQRRLASLTEAVPARYALDDGWDDAVAYCLEQGYWNFAMRAVQADSSTSVSPSFGFEFAFTKPEDWVRTFIASSDESLSPQLNGTQLRDEAGYWYANCDPLFIKYVSSDTAYGGDLSLWPATFADYVAIRLANLCCGRVMGSNTKLEILEKKEKRARIDARSKDAMNEGVEFPPRGTWVMSRGTSRSSSNRDDGDIQT